MELLVSDMIDRIKSLNPNKNLDFLGYSASTISTWKTKNTFPKGDDLINIATQLNVSVDWLLTGKEFENKLSDNELELLSNFRLLDDHDKNSMLLMMEALAGK